MSSRPALDPALLSHLISAQRLEDRRGRRGSGIATLDRLLGGGWPRASLCELIGRRSSGRTAILYAALARAIAAGEAAALVDVGGGLDPRQARGREAGDDGAGGGAGARRRIVRRGRRPAGAGRAAVRG